MIAGMETVDSGVVRFDSENADRHISWMVQSSPLLTRRSVWDNVALGSGCLGAEPAPHEILSVLERLKIDHLAMQKVQRLSGGERQRVAVARGLIAGTGILLADEPTASLDAVSRDAVTDALREAGQTCLVFVATHDSRVAEACDKVLRVDGGTIIDG